MERLICLAIGYVFGLFQSAYLLGRLHHIDIRDYGSGNSGTTNALRVMGKRAGAMVFWGDALKTIFACLVTRLLFADQPGMLYVYLVYTAFGVILGHNFPCYMNFRGGKGIAATAGLLAALDWRVAALCLVVFLIVVIATRYVSLGSILVLLTFFLCMVRFGLRGDYGIDPEHLWEFYMVVFLITAMGIVRHHANIGRLLSGTENKLGAKRKDAN
ncbi:MAG: glycerol-3-phosphate 1-O-acyltransferase PlsY [Clostridiales bacterium]|nr:glycerol-3-phosphate 1-O-acyltransferase PlsY [Clostridiales bacterium]